ADGADRADRRGHHQRADRGHDRRGGGRGMSAEAVPVRKPLPVRLLRGLVERETAFLIVILLAMVLFFTLVTPSGTFLSTTNATNIALDTSEILVLAAGVPFAIIAAGRDLPVRPAAVSPAGT